MACRVIGGSMLRSLRSKLVLSHFIVILTAFMLTAVIAATPIRRVQEARLRNSLVLSSESVARQMDLSRTISAESDLVRDTTQVDFVQRLISAEQQRSGNRILLVNASGEIVLDSNPAPTLAGQTLPNVALAIDQLRQRIGTAPPPARGAARIALVLETYSMPAGTRDGRRMTVGASGATSQPNRTHFYVVAWAQQDSAPLVDDVVRPLAFASAIALLAAVIIGLLISRSVTGPLRRLTDSVSGISAAGLDERVDVETGGEVATLVTAFNRMLDRLAATYQSQRELLANIAHELRTPLTSIQGYAQALRDGVIHEDEDRDDALQTISDEARRMTTLVEHILQLSRLESGQLLVQYSEIAAAAVLERIARQFAPLAAEHSVQLQVNSDSELVFVADPELLVQALGNLTHNAIRHTPPGGNVELRAGRVLTSATSAGVRIVVKDTGEGVSASELERIFERFYRAGERSKQVATRNFGLGLSIVQEIVARHGGHISVESAPGLGTTFTIDLPQGPPDGSAAQA